MTSLIGRGAAAVPGSGIREIVNLAIRMPPADIDRLEIGEPDFRTPELIVDAAHVRALAGVGYTQSAGTAELRSALADRLERHTGLRYPDDDVIVTAGGMQACSLVMSALLEPGSEVLVPDPAWPNYEMLVRLHGGVPVRYSLPAERGFEPDPAELEALVTDATRLIVMNSPGNPTGAVFEPETVRAIVDLAARRGFVVLSDEVYDEFVFEGAPAHAVAHDRDVVVGVYSFSKTYAMTGWRVGYVAPPAWLAPTLWRLQEALVSCVSEVSQAAALAALAAPEEVVAGMRDAYRSRRDLAVELLSAGGVEVVVPRGAFYLMVPFADGVDSRLACLELVGRGLSLAPGSAFGDVAEGMARISLAASEETLRRGIGRLLDWYAETGGGAHLSRAVQAGGAR